MATLHIRMAEASQARVWELATSGRRIAPLPARSENGELVITVSVRNTDGRARMTYEIAVE
jgi:hypothetical protein